MRKETDLARVKMIAHVLLDKLESFRNDPVIADAVETLHQELDGPEAGLEMGGL